MTQLQNADRLNLVMELGNPEQSGTDEDGAPVESFKSKFRTMAGLWSLSTSQIVQKEGNGKSTTVIYVVHHHPILDYEGVTQARINNTIYEIIDTNPDPFHNPTAYDLITLQEVDHNG